MWITSSLFVREELPQQRIFRHCVMSVILERVVEISNKFSTGEDMTPSLCLDCKHMRRMGYGDNTWTFSCTLSSEKGSRFETPVNPWQRACSYWSPPDNSGEVREIGGSPYCSKLGDGLPEEAKA